MFAKHSGGKHSTTPVGQLIDVATDSTTNTTENWMLYMEICDVINQTEEGPKDASKAIRKKFATKNAPTISYTLSLLETCVKNCGKRFHVHIATKDFLTDMLKVINPKNYPSMQTQVTVLGLIQTWALAFSKSLELKEVMKTYQELKAKGVEFPPLDPDQASSVNIPSWSAKTVAVTEVVPPRNAHPPPMAGQPMCPPGAPSSLHGAGGGAMSAERSAKLRTELQTVQQNCRVFGDLLTEINSGQENPADVELLEDLSTTCRQMQTRIMALIQSVEQEQVTEELLAVNDELNNVFLRYDRYQRLKAGRAGGQPPPTSAGNPLQAGTGGASESYAIPTYMQQPMLYDNAARVVAGQTGGGPGGRGAVPPSPKVCSAPTANLIDLGPGSPGHAGPQGSTLQRGGANLGAEFSQLGLGGGGGSASGDDFAALAQSRQTNERAPPLKDKESDIAEMQKWLMENPSASSVAPSSESTTNHDEFERFLAQRQQEAETLPNVGGSAGPRPDNEPLFSL